MRLTLISTLLVLCTVPSQAAPTQASSADDLMIVHCLLPGQLRQLGNRTTYMSPRQPARTTALDCRVRGGEYVLQDRANLKSAMRVWLQAAQKGDADAQATLGEIFEQGLGVPPDYQAARTWYEKAAAQNQPRALTNLGNLYERGLGVAQDPGKALQMYRQAAGLPAGLPEAVVIDQAADVAPVDSLLREEVGRLQQALQVMRDEGAQLRETVARSRQELERAVKAADLAADTARQEGVTQIQQKADRDAREALAAQALRISEYEQGTAERDAQIAQLQSALYDTRKDQSDTQRMTQELSQLSVVIEQQRRAMQENQTQLSRSDLMAQEMQQQLQQQQVELARSEREAQSKVDEVQQLLKEIESLRQQNAAVTLQISTDALLAGPKLTIVDPLLPSTRGLVKVSVPAPVQNVRKIVGRVTAPAGLLSLTINSEPSQPNAAGVFTYQMRGAGDVQVTAIDQQGKRADVRFAFVAPSTPPSQKPTLPQIDMGNFHALLIGNSSYQHLPQLDTPDNDIDELNAVLTERYGFSVTVLRNATRYQMLSALNDLRARLSSDDNLLIYYAGHGELDRTNMRGHWLPVDAEPNSTANWVSNVAITDILNVIQARQIMLVVDSCYSGTLTRSSLTNISTAMTDQERETWLNLMASKKARVVLTSGGLAPVMDAGGGEHSVFASAFLQVLAGNADLLTGRSLYEAIAARVAFAASRYDFEQIPAYAPIARSGHEAGDFMLLPVQL